MVKKHLGFIVALAVVCSPLLVRGQSPAREILTLEEARDQFMKRNLTLEAARLEIGIAEAERIAARLRPRPGLTVSAENLKLSGETPQNRLNEFGATVAQPIELGNRQARRMELAELTVKVAEARLTDVLLKRLFELKRGYYEALVARAVLSIEEENRDNFAGLVRFNTVRFEEGYISEGEVIKVRLERIKYDSALANAALAFRQARVRLLETLGETNFERAGTIDVERRMEIAAAKLDLAQLRAAAPANNPGVKIAEAEVARTESALKLERSIAKGEVTPYAGYKRVGVDNTVLAGVTVPLPFGNRNQGGIARAEAEQRVSQTKVVLARNRALAEVESAYRAYETARELVQAYQTGLLKQADESRDITLEAYQEGAVELIALLDAQRTRSEVRTNYYRALFEYYKSIFELELATGTEINL